jgi:uncharacterized protein YegP (UPF0339 family)
MALIDHHIPLGLEIADSGLLPVEQGGAGEDSPPIMEQWGLRERRPARPLLPPVSNDVEGMYFEVYQVPEVAFTAILRGGGEWRWRLCSSEGSVAVASGSYPTEAACISAIDILRGSAGTADFRQRENA